MPRAIDARSYVAIIFLIVVRHQGGRGILHAEIDDASSGESDERVVLFREFLPTVDPLSRYQRFMQIISSKVYASSDTIRCLVQREDGFFSSKSLENLLAYIIDSQERRIGSGRSRSRSRYESSNESEDIVVWKMHEKGARNIWRFLSQVFLQFVPSLKLVCSTSFRGKLNDFINLGTHRKGQEQEIKLYVSPIMSKKKNKRCKIINTYRYLKWTIFHQRLGYPHALRIFITLDLRYKTVREILPKETSLPSILDESGPLISGEMAAMLGQINRAVFLEAKSKRRDKFIKVSLVGTGFPESGRNTVLCLVSTKTKARRNLWFGGRRVVAAKQYLVFAYLCPPLDLPWTKMQSIFFAGNTNFVFFYASSRTSFSKTKGNYDIKILNVLLFYLLEQIKRIRK